MIARVSMNTQLSMSTELVILRKKLNMWFALKYVYGMCLAIMPLSALITNVTLINFIWILLRFINRQANKFCNFFMGHPYYR